jgi:hypothetical protein
MSGIATAICRTSESLNTGILSRESLNAQCTCTAHIQQPDLFVMRLCLILVFYCTRNLARQNRIRLLGIRIG